MPKATCRCGAILEVPDDGTDRIVCAQCGAKVRIRRDPAAAAAKANDGFIRFDCPCGRRLKVRDEIPPQKAGKCPDCGRIVPVPAVSEYPANKGLPPHETPTDEMGSQERDAIERWAASHESKAAAGLPNKSATQLLIPSAPPPKASTTKIEAGLRVCPRCGKPLHLSATSCRDCGAPVPKR